MHLKIFALILGLLCVNVASLDLPEQCLRFPDTFCKCSSHYRNDRQLYEELYEYYKPHYLKLLAKLDEQIGDKVGNLINDKYCAPPLTREAIYCTILDQCGINRPNGIYKPIWQHDKWEINDKCKWISTMSHVLCMQLKQTSEAYEQCDVDEVFKEMYEDPLQSCVDDCAPH